MAHADIQVVLPPAVIRKTPSYFGEVMLFDLPEVSVMLIMIVVAASTLQAATGIGFGVIAGPALLITMGSASAIQASILLSLLIALLVSPWTLKKVDRHLLRPILVGICIGSPIGAVLFALMTIGQLKVGAAIAVGFMALAAAGLFDRFPLFTRDSGLRRGAAGGVSGLLNSTLAMPGPPIAAYTTAIRQNKETIRATTLTAFLIAYPISFALQWGVAGLSDTVMPMVYGLALPTAGGTVLGVILGKFLPYWVFRTVVVLFLIASVVNLLG